MRSTKYIFLAVAGSLGLVSCEPEFENELSNASYTNGTADFSKYVAVGNSLTSGYMDGTMSRVGQEFSFPNLLAKQFALVGGGEFTQPSFSDDVNNVGGLLLGGNSIAATKMIINLNKVGGAGPEVINIPSTIDITNLQQRAYNNMGVPGAKSFHLTLNGYGSLSGVATGTANPYFVRHATSSTTSVLADAMSLNPTFFTNWIGSNDVLAYALSGGTGVDQTGNFNPQSYGSSDITDPVVFSNVYNGIVNTLTSNGAKGVLATVPYVSSIPYFTTVPHNPLTLKALGGGNEAVGAGTVNQLNAQLIGPLKQVLTAYGQGDRIKLYSNAVDAANPVLIMDETLSDMSAQISGGLKPGLKAALEAQGMPSAQAEATATAQAAAIGQVMGRARHAKATDLLVLTASSAIGSNSTYPSPLDKLGVTFPLGDSLVLIPSEQTAIKNATDAYNSIIRQVAASKDLAVADMNDILSKLSSQGLVVDGIKYGAGYFSTGTVGTVLFSLDGVHPNARGYALVANEVIKVIEAKYGAKLPKYTPNTLPGANILTSN